MERLALDFLVEKLTQYKAYAVAVPSSAMLNDLFSARGLVSRVCSGYLLIDDDAGKYAVFHVWTEAGGVQYDVGSEVTRRLYPENFVKVTIRLSEQLPEGYTRIDLHEMKEVEGTLDSQRQLSNYLTNKAKYWDNASVKLQLLKKLMFKKFKT